MDYAERLRLKVFGRAGVVDVRDRPELAAGLRVPGYHAVVEQVFTVTVVAYDWNCQQHITPPLQPRRAARADLRRTIMTQPDGFLIPPGTPHDALDLGPDIGRMLSTSVGEAGRAIATLCD